MQKFSLVELARWDPEGIQRFVAKKIGQVCREPEVELERLLANRTEAQQWFNETASSLPNPPANVRQRRAENPGVEIEMIAEMEQLT